ncbi:response regulator [Cohnella cellulosilytica]|uniref:Response regulator n=1 Tax=Cohnella cellulosilytica TaxID=986710 RepID=A0ABW2FNQ5_9BACL
MYKVLIVDDEPQIVHGLSKQTHWEDFNMIVAATATNGVDALAAMEDGPIDLLIADVCMPQMDGLELILEVKRKSPSLRCIIISAFNEFEFVKSALQLGVENYLLKPINGDELSDTLIKTQSNLDSDRSAASPYPPAVHVFRANILERWANGSIQEFELYERAELLQIELSESEYRVVVMDLYRLPESADRIRLASQWLDLCASAMSSEYRGEFFMDSALRVVCILHGSDLAQGDERLVGVIQRIAARAAASDTRFFASIGPVSPSFTGVNASYSAALFHLGCRLVDPAALYTFSGLLSDPRQGVPNERQLLVLHFENALRDGEQQTALKWAKNYMESSAAAGLAEMRAAMLPLVLSLVRAMDESGRVSDELPESITLRLAEFTLAESKDELTSWLAATLNEALLVIHGRKVSYHMLVHLTLEQLRQNYHTGLSLKTLASDYNVSPAYLGQLFKEETGKYFNDYLLQIRLQASKALLLDTDLKIGEISNRIGIPNQSYFNRIFKKVHGISPVEFRRHAQMR